MISWLTRFFSGAKIKPVVPDEFLVGENVSSVWSYHLRRVSENVALCDKDKRVMPTSIPFQAWGVNTHGNEHWCRKCAELAGLHLP